MIDPQGQANRWIRKMCADKDLEVTTMKDVNLLRSLENCVRVGKPLLIEDVEEAIEPALEPILQRAVFKQGGRLLINIGDTEVDYDENFGELGSTIKKGLNRDQTGIEQGLNRSTTTRTSVSHEPSRPPRHALRLGSKYCILNILVC